MLMTWHPFIAGLSAATMLIMDESSLLICPLMMTVVHKGHQQSSLKHSDKSYA